MWLSLALTDWQEKGVCPLGVSQLPLPCGLPQTRSLEALARLPATPSDLGQRLSVLPEERMTDFSFAAAAAASGLVVKLVHAQSVGV